MDKDTKIRQLEAKLKEYEEKLAFKMKRYRGVIHESAASEMKHQTVMVLRAMVADIKKELQMLKSGT